MPGTQLLQNTILKMTRSISWVIFFLVICSLSLGSFSGHFDHFEKKMDGSVFAWSQIFQISDQIPFKKSSKCICEKTKTVKCSGANFVFLFGKTTHVFELFEKTKIMGFLPEFYQEFSPEIQTPPPKLLS